MYQSTTMSEPLRQKNSEQTELVKSISSQVASPAKMCHAPDLEKALKTAMGKLLAADCGESTQDLLTNLGQDGLWQKTYGVYCQPLLISDREATSELFSGTWPTWGMMRSGRVTELKPLAHRTKEKEPLLWPTVVASDGAQGAVIGKDDSFYTTSTGMPRKVNRNGTDGSVGLGRLVQMWPTPAARDWKDSGDLQKLADSTHQACVPKMVAKLEMKKDAGKIGALNSDWVELLMGLPIGWTDIDCEEPQPWPGWPAPMNAGSNWNTPDCSDRRSMKSKQQGVSNQVKVTVSGQYPYEPPRVVVGQKNRAKRLKCLGNGCCPAQIYPIFKAIMEIERVRK